MPDFTLADLAKIIAERARSGDAGSYTAKLRRRRCRKDAPRSSARRRSKRRSPRSPRTTRRSRRRPADVLYHLLVMLEARGVPLDAVMAELGKRTRASGLAEKASRRKGEGKI